MKLKNLITIQKLIIYLAIVKVVFLCLKYYYPWIYTVFFDEFRASHFIEPNDRYELVREVKGFYFRFTIQTIKFITTSIVLILVLLNITRILYNFEEKSYFKEYNISYLTKSGTLLMILAGILLLLNLIDSSSYFIQSGITFFVGSLLFVLGSVFRIAFKQKQENDLTI